MSDHGIPASCRCSLVCPPRSKPAFASHPRVPRFELVCFAKQRWNSQRDIRSCLAQKSCHKQVETQLFEQNHVNKTTRYYHNFYAEVLVQYWLPCLFTKRYITLHTHKFLGSAMIHLSVTGVGSDEFPFGAFRPPARCELLVSGSFVVFRKILSWMASTAFWLFGFPCFPSFGIRISRDTIWRGNAFSRTVRPPATRETRRGNKKKRESRRTRPT